MELGINGSTTELCSLAEDIEIAAAAGYSAVEVRMPKIDAYLEKNSFADLRAHLDNHAMRVFTINSIENATFRDAAGQRAIRAEAEKFARYAAELSCPWLIICPGTCPDNTPWSEIIDRSAAELAAIADIAWKHRVGVAYEFLGFPGISIRTPSDAWAVIKQANRGNLGLTIDVANFSSGRGRLSEIAALPPGAVAVFHMNDLRDMPPEDAGAYDRVMPGDGAGPVAEVTRELKRIGYNGICSVEIFNHDYNKRPPLEVAREAFEKTRAFTD